jgi:superfamily II DNA or RNA helicase
VAVSESGEWRLPLRGWQRDAFETWTHERPADALIVATPGAGKTRFAARVVHAALGAREVRRVFIVVPREHLKAQVARVFAQSGIQLDHAFANATRTLASDVHGAVVTYQQVAAAPRLFRDLVRVPSIVVLDEIHHAGEEATWGQALRDAFGGTRFRLSMSGTPFRSDGSPIPFVRYEAGLSVADFSYDYASALQDARSSSRCMAAKPNGSAVTDGRCMPRSMRNSNGATKANACAPRSRSRRGSATCW